MPNPTLKAEVRKDSGTRAVRRLRREGRLPAVLYGRKQEAVALVLSERDFLREAAGRRMVDLLVDGQAQTALIKEVQYDALQSDVVHVDFHRIAMDERITILVPLLLKGRPVGVEAGGFLDQPVKRIPVECLPADIPESLTLEVAALEIGDALFAKELKPPERVKILLGPERLLASVVPPHAEAPAAEAAPVEAAPSEPELIRPEKKAEEEEGPEEGKKEGKKKEEGKKEKS